MCVVFLTCTYNASACATLTRQDFLIQAGLYLHGLHNKPASRVNCTKYTNGIVSLLKSIHYYDDDVSLRWLQALYTNKYLMLTNHNSLASPSRIYLYMIQAKKYHPQMFYIHTQHEIYTNCRKHFRIDTPY